MVDNGNEIGFVIVVDLRPFVPPGLLIHCCLVLNTPPSAGEPDIFLWTFGIMNGIHDYLSIGLTVLMSCFNISFPWHQFSFSQQRIGYGLSAAGNQSPLHQQVYWVGTEPLFGQLSTNGRQWRAMIIEK